MKPMHSRGWLCGWLALTTAGLAFAEENDASIQRLQLVKYVAPEFPVSLRAEGVPTGLVTVAISHAADGQPSDVLVLEASHPSLRAAALTAVRQWRFAPQAPAMVGQAPPALVRIAFSLSGVVVTYSSAEYEQARRAAEDLHGPVRVKLMAELPVPPRALHQPMPGYPPALAGRELEGQAKVAFYVDTEGRVRLAHVLEATTPQFAEAALAAVREWRYEPPRDRGEPTVVAEHWVFQFTKRGP